MRRRRVDMAMEIIVDREGERCLRHGRQCPDDDRWFVLTARVAMSRRDFQELFERIERRMVWVAATMNEAPPVQLSIAAPRDHRAMPHQATPRRTKAPPARSRCGWPSDRDPVATFARDRR